MGVAVGIQVDAGVWGLLFADALIDGVLIVNQMRATHTIFHCTCIAIDRSMDGWMDGWMTDLYDNLSQH